MQNRIKVKDTSQVRIRDIAEALQISSSTVSRALRQGKGSTSGVNPELVARIKAKANEMGYISNIFARSLRTGKTNTVGVLVPDILNPIFPPIIHSIQSHLYDAGFITMIAYSENNIDIAQREVERFIARKVDGLIIASAFIEDPSINYCREQNIPLVLAYRSTSGNANFNQVLNDEELAVELAIDHLIELGHTSICHLAGPENIQQGLERLHVFLRYCSEKSIQPSHVQCEEFSIDEGYKAAEKLLSKPHMPTACLAGNDLIAVGALKFFKRAGIQVPRDMSLIGINGMPFIDMFDPPLTSVMIAHKEIGRRSAEMLLEFIRNPQVAVSVERIKPELVVLKSTALPKT